MNLGNLSELDLNYNLLTATDTDLIAWLDELNPDWEKTQFMPVLIAPSGSISQNRPTYQWRALPNAEYYLLVVADATLATQDIHKWYSAAEAGCADGTGICSVTPNVALNPGKAFWWVQASNFDGEGPSSEPMSIIVSIAKPEKAVLVSPNGNVADDTPIYTWNAVDSATWYQVWVNDANGQVVTNWWYQVHALDCAKDICQLEPAIVLNKDKSYTWWVRAWNPMGSGAWSEAMDFTVTAEAGPPATKLNSPHGFINENPPTYTWEAVETATWYYLWINGSTGEVYKKWYKASDICDMGRCQITPAIGLKRWDEHTWWVQTWNDIGSGAWSDGMMFTPSTEAVLPPPAATLVSPFGSITETTPRYVWDEVETATWYYLWVNGPSGVAVHKKWYKTIDVCDGMGRCQLSPALNLELGNHTWWVQTWNEVGYGAWSEGMDFTVE